MDGEISALLLLPEGRSGPSPAVLWLHSSTPDKTQIITPGTNGGSGIPGGRPSSGGGYAVFAPDAYWHGDRVGTGPAGAFETGRAEQESLLKLHLWMGRTLWGMFVRDDQIALDYLSGAPEVDPARIRATGMSMGSTRAWWLAAVDERVAATAAVACLTRYRNLIAHGQLRAHGVYYFVQGLLRHFDTEAVLALIAPRPFLAVTGDPDAGSPADGIRELERQVGAVYGALGAGDRFRNVLYPDVGHTYTARCAPRCWPGSTAGSPEPTDRCHLCLPHQVSSPPRGLWSSSRPTSLREERAQAPALLQDRPGRVRGGRRLPRGTDGAGIRPEQGLHRPPAR